MFSCNAVVQAQFLFAGFMSSNVDGMSDETGMGQIEVAQYLTPWASAIASALEYLNTAGYGAFPGVFEYDVTEAFGACLRQDWGSTNEYFVSVLCSAIRDWFADNGESLTEPAKWELRLRVCVALAQGKAL
jgi:hypothetical protein